MTKANMDPLGVLAKVSGKQTETARVTNIHVGICPICNMGMKVTKVKLPGKDLDAYACIKDRVCMPVQNAPILDLY